jgi:large subunit ribosomal protein L31
MKTTIHPAWHAEATVTCACGNTFTTGSTVEAIQVDICSKCHPFFTGEMRFVDRQGRVDRFMQKMQLAQEKQATKAQKSKKSAANNGPSKSYQDILKDQQSRLKAAKKAA